MKNSIAAVGAAILVVFLTGAALLQPALRMLAGYKAKIVCSETFVAGRALEEVLGADFAGLPGPVDALAIQYNETARTVTAAAPFGYARRRAVHRDGYGCTLVAGGAPEPLAPLPPIAAGDEWPVAGDGVELPDSVDASAMQDIVDNAFDNNDAAHRAVLVIVDGVIVAERYAPGFSADTPFLSWSMAKSVTASLVGAAVLSGHVDIREPMPAPEWTGDTEHPPASWEDFLRMSSALAFDESYYNPTSDASRMLWDAREAAGVAASQPSLGDPGSRWSYSSGTSNLIARSLGQALREDGVDLYSFAREKLFSPIGASSFVLETDASGHFIGSSFAYATARDWARLGALYLNDGVADGTRILPQGWADYVARPTPPSDNQYGAHFWLNLENARTGERPFAGLPANAYYMSGHEGQFVMIIPGSNMIIVRTGMTRGRAVTPVLDPFVTALYEAAS
ncbi:MAG: serine hydrolase [Pseudomonadota bacterium]